MPSLHVLLVDDDPDFARALCWTLAARGHSCEVVTSPFGLKNRLAGRGDVGKRPDVVVYEARLPSLSGGAALELIGADERTCDVPVILVSDAPGALPLDAVRAHGRCLPWAKDGRLSSLVQAIQALWVRCRREDGVEHVEQEHHASL